MGYADYVKQKKEGKLTSNKSGGYARYSAEKRLNLDTFESDLAAASDLVNKVYSGWQSADDMKSSYKTVSAMRERLNAHKSYTNDYGNGQDLTKYNESIDKLISAYDTALSDWDALSAEYAKYADADAYGVAKKNAERYNKYKGLDFDGVRKAMEENPDDAEFLSRYGLNVGYENKDDVEHELNMVDYLIETTSGEEKKAWKEYRNRLYEATMVNPNALFKGSEAFADGYQPGDLLDALGATAADAFLRGTKGFLGSMEGLADLGAYGVSKAAGFFGLDGVEDSLKNFAQKNMTQDLYRPLYSTSINEDSFLGGLGHSVGEGVGQMGFNLMTGKMGAGFGKNGAGIASKAGMFASSAGSGMSEAYNSGATDMEALAYGLMSGTVETGSEMMFGGLGKSVNALGLSRGIAGLDDQFARKVGSKINNLVLRNAAEMGIKAAGEGLEEMASGLGSAVAKKFTYMSDEDLMKLIDDEDLLNQFLVGTLSSTFTQTPSLMRSYKYGTDFVTDRTDAEEFYITSEYEARLAEAEKDGKKLSNKEKDKLYRQVEKDLTTAQEEAYNAAKKNAPNAVGRMAHVDVTDTIDNETGSKIKVQGIRTDNSGNTVLKTSVGERNLDAVTLNRRDAELVAMAEEMEESRADLFVSMYNGQDATQYKDSFDMAYTYGKNAFGVVNAMERHGVLTESQALQVYKLGVSERTAAPQKKADAITEEYFSEGGTIKAGTFSDKGVNYKKLNSRQRAVSSLAKMFSKATGVNVVLFESKVDKNGVRKSENGRYDKSTNTIYIDVYAGFKENEGVFEDSMVPTIAHELTHWMKEKAPEAYAKLSEIVMDTLSRHYKTSPEVLVAVEKNNHKKRGRDVSDEYAQDELIARACEDMFSGNKTANEIIEQMDEETAKTFSEKFKEVVAKIRAWLKELLGVYKSNSEEAKILRRYDDKLAELQKAWDEGLEKAIKANQAMQNSEAEDVAASERTKNSDRIEMGMSDEERYNILKNKSIELIAKTDADKMDQFEEKYAVNDVYELKEGERKKLFKKLGDEFSVFKQYENADVELSFVFSKGNMAESTNKQKGNYELFAKMFSCFDDVVSSAVGIEVHNRNDEGYKKDPTLKAVYVLVSAFEDGSYIVPVKLEVKEFNDKNNTLYVAIALESIKKDEVVKKGNTTKGVTQFSRSSKISLTDLFRKINTSDESFVKYIPKQFFDEGVQRSDRDATDHVKTVEEYFGRTYNINEAGYILINGHLLDMSGRHEGASGGYRSVDHREISDALGDDYGGDDYSGAMIEFMREGNIRIMPEGGGINVSVKPNSAQMEVLSRYVSKFRGEVTLDIDDLNGNTIASVEYPKYTHANTVLKDITDYFEKGKIPEPFKAQFSDRDSEGNGLTAAQVEYFKNSKLRDENGNLKVMYHGTGEASFTVFDIKHSDDGISLFFTDNKKVAKGYSGTYEEYVPGKKYTVDELTDIIGNSYLFVEEENGKYNIVRNRYGEFIDEYTTDTLEEMQEYVLSEYASVGPGNYKVYLNLTNPLIIDGDGRNWDDLPLSKTTGVDRYNYIYITGKEGAYNVEWEDMMSEYGEAESAVMTLDDIRRKFGSYVAEGVKNRVRDFDSIVIDSKTKELIPRTTRQYAYFAKKNGYDGVIFNDIYDIAVHASGSEKYESSTVAIAFDSNQVKSVYNENPTGDSDIRFSDRDSNGNGLTKEQIEFFKDSKVRDENGRLKVMYHGTPNAGFTVFRSGTYFTDNKEYADVYQSQGASSLGYKQTADNPDTYAVYLNIKKPFDTRNKAERDIFYNEYYRKYGMGTDLMESGLPDWMDGMDLQEFLEENGYDYDGLILDEGGVGGYGDEVKSRGLSYVVFNANQVKDITNQNPTENEDIRRSDRQTESIYDAVGELKRIQRENDKLKADIERLRKKNRLERTVTGGRELNESHVAAVAGHVLKMADSRYSKADFTSELKVIYEYLQGEDVTWDEFMSKATDVAQRIVAEAREHKVKDDYAMMILSTIRNARVSFNDTQKAEAEYAYGKNWNRNYFGRVTVANDGIPLESAWSEWASMYPDVFDADISDADMVTALLDIYDSTRTASEVVETYDKSEAARAIAFEIYNQFWNVSPVRTLADKHDKEVKRLKFEHRQEMKELRERKDAEVFETKWHYSKLIHEVREARDEKIAQLKKESREYTKQYREKVERRNQISQITKKSLKLNTWLKKNSKDEHIVEELKAPVAAVLKALDFSSERFLGTGVPTQKDISLKKAFAHLHDSLDEIYKRQGEENYTIDMPVDYVEFVKGIKNQVDGIVEKVGDNEYVLRDMTLEQLQDMNKMLSVLTHIVTSANKALADANGKAISSMAQSTMVYADDLGEKSKKVGAISDFFNFDNGLPVYVFKMFGEGGRHIFRNLQDGWDKMAFHVKQIIDYSKESYDAKEVKEWSKDVHEFTFSDGSNVKMTTAQIMSLYCLQKREQARLHLLRGGMRVADFKIGTNTISNEDGALMLPHEIDEVVSTLTDRQKQVADSLQKFMNTVCSDWGNEVSMKRFGIKSFGEENYFPIQSDASVLTGDDTPKTDRGSDVFRLLNMDFTKALNPHANNRIMVDNIFDVFATHTSDMAKYNALALPVLDMFRWYNYKESYRINPEDPEDTRMRAKSLKQSLKKAYGEGSAKYIMQFMKDLNGAHSGGMSNLEKVGRKMISNYKVAAVGANLRVALLQPTSYVRASAVMDPKYLTAALAHKPQIQKAKDTCGIALWKSLGFYDTNISRGVTALIKHDNGWYQKAKEISMKLAEWGDAMTWGYLYNACEAEIKATQPVLTGAAKDKAVADRLREVIYATQVVDSTMTRTQNMRNPSTMNQIMTSFMSEPSLSYNLLHDLYIQYNADKRQYGKGAAFKKNGKRIARVSASYLITLCCASLAGGFVDTLRDDEDDEEFVDALISNAVENALSDAISMLPLVKDVVSIYKGFNVGRMDMQGIQSSYYAFRKLYKAIMEGEWDYKNVYSLANSIGKAVSQNSGLPLSNLWREFTTIWNNTIGEMYESLKLK